MIKFKKKKEVQFHLSKNLIIEFIRPIVNYRIGIETIKKPNIFPILITHVIVILSLKELEILFRQSII